MKKVSIVMPIYNVERYIKKSIKSVLNQTHENFELILVDDGSTDRSGNIADQFAKRDTRIKVIHKKNGGLSDARNVGMSQATGEYMVFIDSDDYWESDLLKSVFDFNKNGDLDIVVFGYVADFYGADSSITHTENHIEETKVIIKESQSVVDIKHKNLLGYAWNKVYRTSLIRGRNLMFAKGVSYVEDILFNSQAFQCAKKVGFLGMPLYHYSQRSSETLGKKYYSDMGDLDILANQEFCKALRALNVSDKDISTFSSRNLYMKARWSIYIIANTDRIGRKTKIEKIKKILDYLNVNLNKKALHLSRKDIFYLGLFKLGMIGTLLLIENSKSRNYKRYIRDVVPNNIKSRITYYLSSTNEYRNIRKNTKKIIVALAADYGNLGDVAITYAQLEFLKNNFKDYKIIELPISKTYQNLKSLKSKISPNDIITTVGGGNMGDLYEDIEEQRRFVITKFPDNPIISFPQTIDFSKYEKLESLQKTKNTYESHKKLVILAREQKSFDLMGRLFKNKIFLTPDIVLSLNEVDAKIKRTDVVTLCIREDVESSLNKTNKQELVDYLNKQNLSIQYRDTHIGDVKLDRKAGEEALSEIWTTFKTSKLVITDRLHGMIFCAITRTPCIAINNSNGKVAGVYDRWLKNTNYIRMIDSFNIKKIKENVQYLTSLKVSEINALELDNEFKRIKNIITDSII